MSTAFQSLILCPRNTVRLSVVVSLKPLLSDGKSVTALKTSLIKMPREEPWNPESLFKICLELIAYRVKNNDRNTQVTSSSNLVEDGKSVSKSAVNPFDELRESLFTFASYCYFYLCSHILIFIFILATYFLEQIINVIRSKGWLNINNHQDLLVAANTRKLDISYTSGIKYQNSAALLELAAIRCQVCAGIQLFIFFLKLLVLTSIQLLFAATYFSTHEWCEFLTKIFLQISSPFSRSPRPECGMEYV